MKYTKMGRINKLTSHYRIRLVDDGLDLRFELFISLKSNAKLPLKETIEIKHTDKLEISVCKRLSKHVAISIYL